MNKLVLAVFLFVAFHLVASQDLRSCMKSCNDGVVACFKKCRGQNSDSVEEESDSARSSYYFSSKHVSSRRSWNWDSEELADSSSRASKKYSSSWRRDESEELADRSSSSYSSKKYSSSWRRDESEDLADLVNLLFRKRRTSSRRSSSVKSVSKSVVRSSRTSHKRRPRFDLLIKNLLKLKKRTSSKKQHSKRSSRRVQKKRGFGDKVKQLIAAWGKRRLSRKQGEKQRSKRQHKRSLVKSEKEESAADFLFQMLFARPTSSRRHSVRSSKRPIRIRPIRIKPTRRSSRVRSSSRSRRSIRPIRIRPIRSRRSSHVRSSRVVAKSGDEEDADFLFNWLFRRASSSRRLVRPRRSFWGRPRLSLRRKSSHAKRSSVRSSSWKRSSSMRRRSSSVAAKSGDEEAADFLLNWLFTRASSSRRVRPSSRKSRISSRF